MKYVIVPIVKTVGLILMLLGMYPVMYLVAIFWALWHWNLKKFDEIVEGDFQGPPDFVFKDEKYHTYTTIWDWYLDRKTWHTKE